MNRYYSANLGRFYTPDPSGSADPGDPGSWNRYAYVQEDPVNLNDPSGASPCLPRDVWVISWDGETYTPILVSSTDTSSCWGGDLVNGTDPWLRITPAMINRMIFTDGYADAMTHLGTPDCAGLFAGSQMSVLGVANAQDLLRLYYQQSWLSYGTTFTPNGGGDSVSFAGQGPDAVTNLGAVTTYANASYPNANGVRVSVNSIALNVDSFVFTGDVQTAGGMAAVGQVVPSQFGGMTQPDITGAAIIHELLHAVGAIPQDATSPEQSGKNSALVKEKCYP